MYEVVFKSIHPWHRPPHWPPPHFFIWIKIPVLLGGGVFSYMWLTTEYKFSSGISLPPKRQVVSWILNVISYVLRTSESGKQKTDSEVTQHEDSCWDIIRSLVNEQMVNIHQKNEGTHWSKPINKLTNQGVKLLQKTKERLNWVEEASLSPGGKHWRSFLNMYNFLSPAGGDSMGCTDKSTHNQRWVES